MVADHGNARVQALPVPISSSKTFYIHVHTYIHVQEHPYTYTHEYIHTYTQIFSALGSILQIIGGAREGAPLPHIFLKPYSLATGQRGEIVVADWQRKDIQMFNHKGELMQVCMYVCLCVFVF